MEARAGKYKLGVRAGKYKLEARVGSQGHNRARSKEMGAEKCKGPVKQRITLPKISLQCIRGPLNIYGLIFFILTKKLEVQWQYLEIPGSVRFY